jgi:hypothetical protein
MKVPQQIADNLRDWLDECKAKAPEADTCLRTVVRPTPQSDPWRHDRGRIVS